MASRGDLAARVCLLRAVGRLLRRGAMAVRSVCVCEEVVLVRMRYLEISVARVMRRPRLDGRHSALGTSLRPPVSHTSRSPARHQDLPPRDYLASMGTQLFRTNAGQSPQHCSAYVHNVADDLHDTHAAMTQWRWTDFNGVVELANRHAPASRIQVSRFPYGRQKLRLIRMQ